MKNQDEEEDETALQSWTVEVRLNGVCGHRLTWEDLEFGTIVSSCCDHDYKSLLTVKDGKVKVYTEIE